MNIRLIICFLKAVELLLEHEKLIHKEGEPNVSYLI